MTINQLASAISVREGKKSQVSIGNVREVLKILCAIVRETTIDNGFEARSSALDILWRNAHKDKLKPKPKPKPKASSRKKKLTKRGGRK